MNRRGAILLRDIMFMVILFGGVMALLSIFVLDFAGEYNNTNLTTEYNDLGVSGVGTDVSNNISATIDDQIDATKGEGESSSGGTIQAIGVVGDLISGASKVVKGLLTAPVIAGNSLEILMNSLEVPQVLSKLISNIVIALLWVVIIFGIITALLKGGKM